MYRYKATLLHVVDGDTVDLIVDLGFRTSVRERFRLKGINAFELNHERGKEAAILLTDLIVDLGPIFEIETIKTDKKDKYGRYLLIIPYKETTVNQKLIDAGLAVAYME